MTNTIQLSSTSTLGDIRDYLSDEIQRTLSRLDALHRLMERAEDKRHYNKGRYRDNTSRSAQVMEEIGKQGSVVSELNDKELHTFWRREGGVRYSNKSEILKDIKELVCVS